MSEIDTAMAELGEVLEADAAVFAKGHDSDDLTWVPDWFLSQLAAIDAQDEALEQQFDVLRKQSAAKRRALWWRWGDAFQARVHQDMLGAKKKSVDYAYGRAGIRTVPARTVLVVDDEDAAAAYANLMCPEAVKTTVTPTKLYEFMQNNGGELPPGCEIETTEARESFYPKPPEKGEDDGSDEAQ